MAQTVILQGVTYSIPERKEKGWGSEMTTYLKELGSELDLAITAAAGGSLPSVGTTTTDATIVEGETITQAFGRYRIQGTSGAVTLSPSTAVTDGTTDGNVIYLQGTSDTNTVTVKDVANTKMPGGDCVLHDGDILQLVWDSGLSLWLEVSRNN